VDPTEYEGDDFYCDVAVPHPERLSLVRELLSVVQTLARDGEASTGAAGVLTNLGRYQDSKHLHVHVHSGPRRDGWDR